MNWISYVQFQLRVNSMMKKIALILFSTTLLIAGCATTPSECNPAVRKDTLSTASCIFGGHYKARQLSKEAELREQQAILESSRQIYALLEMEQRGVAGNLVETQKQYKQLNVTLNNLITQISTNSQGNTAIQQKIDQLKKNMTYMNSATSNAQKQLALDSLHIEMENLKKELGYD